MRGSPLTFVHIKWILIKYTFGELPLVTTAIWNHKWNLRPKQRLVHYMIQIMESIAFSLMYDL